MPHSFRYGGVDLGGDSYGMWLERSSEQALAESRIDVQETGGRSGAVRQGATIKPRTWSWNARIIGTSLDNLREKLDAVRSVLDPGLGDQLLISDAEYYVIPSRRRGYYASLSGPIEVQQIGTTATLKLNWIAADPYGYALESTTQTVAIDETPESFNAPASGTVAGTEYALPVWTLTNTDATPVALVTFINTTTAETFRWSGALANTYQLRIDSERQHVELSADGGGTWSNAMYGVNSGDPFPRLKAAVANACSVSGFVTGTLSFTYTARFK